MAPDAALREVALETLLDAVPEREVHGSLPGTVRGLTDDSRRVTAGSCFVAVRGGPERCVTSNDRFDGYVRTPAMTPAGDRVVYERVRVTAKLWLGELP